MNSSTKNVPERCTVPQNLVGTPAPYRPHCTPDHDYFKHPLNNCILNLKHRKTFSCKPKVFYKIFSSSIATHVVVEMLTILWIHLSSPLQFKIVSRRWRHYRFSWGKKFVRSFIQILLMQHRQYLFYLLGTIYYNKNSFKRRTFYYFSEQLFFF